MYNFYVYSIALSILGAVMLFLMKTILGLVDLPDYLLCVQILLMIFVLCWYLFIYKGNLKETYQKMTTNSNIWKYTLLIAITIFLSITIGYVILKKETVLQYAPWKDSGRLLAVTLISILFFKDTLTPSMVCGMPLIIIGIVILERAKIMNQL